MRIEFLRKIRIAENKRCSQLSLFTTGHGIEEIRALKARGRKIVCFGADDYSYFYIAALKEAGIGPDIVTDNGLKTIDLYLDDIPVSQPTALLKEKEKYYFIVALADTNIIDQARRQLLLWGVEDFAILTHDFVFDFDRAAHKGLKGAFIKAFNKIYKEIDFTENHFNEARRRFIAPITWWNEAAEWVLRHYANRKNLSLLDVGPGVGLASLIFKELLGVSLNWINLKRPNNIDMPSTQLKLIESEKINVQYGYIETDDFEGLYDIILLTDVIEHFAYNPVNTLKKLYNMLNFNGCLVITTPHKLRAGKTGLPYYASWRDMPAPSKTAGKDSLDVLKITGANHVYEYTPEELNEIFAESGFKAVYPEIDKPGGIFCVCAKS